MTRTPMERPHVVLSCCLSLDGYLDDTGPDRLILSNADDLDRVDEVRASCDAILVGAGTVRADDPRLAVRSAERRAERVAAGRPPNPLKVTLTHSGLLPPAARMFDVDDSLVFCTSPALARTRATLDGVATVVDGGERITAASMLQRLHEHGVRRLMVEGGGCTLTQFLSSGLVDELHLAIAPLFVGDSRAPRFVRDGCFPWDQRNRAELTDVQRVGDVVVMRYALSARRRHPRADPRGVSDDHNFRISARPPLTSSPPDDFWSSDAP